MFRQNTLRFGGPVTDNVKKIMIINGAVFLVQLVLKLIYPGLMENTFGLSHEGLFGEYRVWQLFTYMFLHGGFLHIIFNLLTLWMFGGELEQIWGKSSFLRFYIFSGIGAGIFIALMNYVVFSRYGYSPVTIGASGAVYGILLAYGMTWPNREVLLYFLFPVKIKYLVIVFGLIEFFGTISSVSGAGGTISHVGHIGGIAAGFILIMRRRKKAQKRINNNIKPQGSIGQFLLQERIKRKQQEIDRRIKAKEIIDSLLEKIAREGMGALSSKEKNDLEWARKYYYPNDDDVVH